MFSNRERNYGITTVSSNKGEGIPKTQPESLRPLFRFPPSYLSQPVNYKPVCLSNGRLDSLSLSLFLCLSLVSLSGCDDYDDKGKGFFLVTGVFSFAECKENKSECKDGRRYLTGIYSFMGVTRETMLEKDEDRLAFGAEFDIFVFFFLVMIYYSLSSFSTFSAFSLFPPSLAHLEGHGCGS